MCPIALLDRHKLSGSVHHAFIPSQSWRSGVEDASYRMRSRCGQECSPRGSRGEHVFLPFSASGSACILGCMILFFIFKQEMARPGVPPSLHTDFLPALQDPPGESRVGGLLILTSADSPPAVQPLCESPSVVTQPTASVWGIVRAHTGRRPVHHTSSGDSISFHSLAQ